MKRASSFSMPRPLPQSRPQFEQRFAIFSLPPFASCILITSFFPLLSLWKFPQRNEIQWKILIQIAANYWGCKATSSSRYFSLSVFVSLSAPVYLYLCFVFFFFFVERFAGCFALEILIAGWGHSVDFQIFTMHIPTTISTPIRTSAFCHPPGKCFMS